MLTCPACSKTNLPGKQFCVGCGHRLDKPAPPPRQAATNPYQTQQMSRDMLRDVKNLRDSGEFRLSREAVRDLQSLQRNPNPYSTQIIPGAAPAKSDSVLRPGLPSRPIAMLCKECQQVTRKKSPYCEHCGRPLPNLEGSVRLAYKWSGGRTVRGEPAIYVLCTVRPSIRFLSGTPSRNLGFLIDNSTLRDGGKVVRKFLEHVIDEMSPSDYLTVAFFGNRAYLLVSGERIEDKKSAKRLIQKKLENIDLGEGRYLREGIEQVCREVRRNLAPEKVNRVVILTDGAIHDPEESLRSCEYEAEQGIGFSTLTLSEGDYTRTMQELATAGNGKCYPNVEFRHIPEILSQELMTVRATFTTQVEMFVHVDPGWAVSRIFKVSPVITDLGSRVNEGKLFSLKLADLQLYDDQTLLLEIVPVAADPERSTIALAELVCDFPHDDVANMTFELPLKIVKPEEAWGVEDEDVLKIVRMIMTVFGRNVATGD